jgi:hypothetical protein
MKSFYAVTFGRSYVARVLCLYRSLQPWLGNKRFGFFCMDDEAAAVLEALRLPHAVVLRHADFATPPLLAVKPTRAMNEYCWTCKPAALQYAFAMWPELDWGVYLDGDMMAFGDPDLELARPDAHVLITPHRFVLEQFRAQEAEAGTHNAGYAAFRNTPEGRTALGWWMERCLELCPNVRTRGVYGDQTYLDHLPGRFPGVVASQHKGLNAAPWNIDGCRVTTRDGQVYCDEEPLLIYHFQGMRLYGLRLYDMYAGPHRLPADAVDHIYRPHLRALAAATREVRGLRPDFAGGLLPFLTAPKTIYHQLRRALTGTNNLSLVLG